MAVLAAGRWGGAVRGWSAVLEIAVEAKGDHLRLVPLDDEGTLIRKHFLQLEGLGIRDLHFHGDDLYILAGPTMVLDGDIHVFRWADARPGLAANRERDAAAKAALHNEGWRCEVVWECEIRRDLPFVLERLRDFLGPPKQPG